MEKTLHSTNERSAISGTSQPKQNSYNSKNGRQSQTQNPKIPKQAPKKQFVPYILQALAMIAITALLYPNAADWISRIGHNQEVSGYVETVEQLPEEVKTEKLATAYQYNRDLPPTVLQDPYGSENSETALENTEAYKAYKKVLEVSDNGVIGELSYPDLKINLPIYHGTGDKAISIGVGHLYGSSLPVGGPSTHSVLTSHSGLVNASLFTSLPKAKIGDTELVKFLRQCFLFSL